jgi:hypothetical protein
MITGNIHDDLRETNDGPVTLSVIEVEEQLIGLITRSRRQVRQGLRAVRPGQPRPHHDQAARQEPRLRFYEWVIYQHIERYFEERRPRVTSTCRTKSTRTSRSTATASCSRTAIRSASRAATASSVRSVRSLAARSRSAAPKLSAARLRHAADRALSHVHPARRRGAGARERLADRLQRIRPPVLRAGPAGPRRRWRSSIPSAASPLSGRSISTPPSAKPGSTAWARVAHLPIAYRDRGLPGSCV